MMNVVHIIPGVGPASFGLGPVALNLAREQLLARAGAQIWCLDRQEVLREAAASSGLRQDRLAGFAPSWPAFLMFSAAMLREAHRQSGGADIVHQHGIWTGISLVSAEMRRRFGTPTVVAPHGSLEREALARSRWKKALVRRLYEDRNLRECSCLHACSPMEFEGFREFGLANPVAVIPNGIASDWLESSGDAPRFREKFGIPAQKRILLYLSRITPVKGLPVLLEALHMARRETREWVLVLAGADEFGHLAEVRDAVSRLGLSDHVLFPGPLYGRDKRDAFAAAELFVLPTKRENFAIVVAEALGAGVPVITTKGAPWGELLSHDCGWWVDVDPEAIAVALKDAVERPQHELRLMGERGRDLVKARYSWSRAAQMTLELYAWLLGQGERPGFVALQ